ILLGLELAPTPEVDELEERFRKERLEEAARDFLGLVLSTPTLLVFEDVHWLDSASRDLLAALVEGLEHRPWTLVLTHRTGGGMLQFRHALVRDVAYEGLPYRRRRELHARIGEALEQLAEDPADQAELLSLHFFHAQRFDEAWRYSRLAGERAMSMYANAAAE